MLGLCVIALLCACSQQTPQVSAVESLQPPVDGLSDLYFLGVSGSSDASLRQVRQVKKFFDAQLGTTGRSLQLTSTEVRPALVQLGRLLDPNEDLLFIYVERGDRPDPLDPEAVASAGLGWRVVVQTGCNNPGGTGLPRDIELRIEVVTTGCTPDRSEQFVRWYFLDAMRQGMDPVAAFEFVYTNYPVHDEFDSLQLQVGAAMASRLHQVALALEMAL